MIKRLIYLLLFAGSLALAGCDSESNSIIEDSVNVNVNTFNAKENDTELEKLITNVGYYYGYKPNLTLFEFAYRAAGQYCIFPKTDRRKAELEQLSQQEGSQVSLHPIADEFFIVTRGRDFITAEDFVSDRYFAGYYTDFYTHVTDSYSGEIFREYIIVCPRIKIWVYDHETIYKILKDYKGKLTLSDHEQGKKSDSDSYKYYFDCHFSNSEQVLTLANKIYLRNDVKYAEASKLAPVHYCN